MESYKCRFNVGTCRRFPNKTYSQVAYQYKVQKERLGQEHTKEAIKALKETQKLLLDTPYYTPADQNYKSLQFNRYADDFVVGIIGSREDAERAKADIRDFLANTLKLTLSEEKTKITHPSELIDYLGYQFTVRRSKDVKRDRNGVLRRSWYGKVALYVPHDKWVQKLKEYQAFNEVNTALLETVRKSSVLKDISRYLGWFREIFAQGKRNGYAYWRGEKYSLELGNDLSRALTSELAMLASPLSAPLFLRKYQRRQIKQYQRWEPVYKGMGDIICCLDESLSTQGDPAAWGKAVALTLLEIAADGNRSFALIHFSGSNSCQVDVFRPGKYTIEDKIRSAETFLGGGTDFWTPMKKAVQLMKEGGFENADIVFITDGECALPEDHLEILRGEKAARHFTITGVLLDKDCPDMGFSLHPFCQNIYHTSELTGEDIVRELVGKRI